MTRNATGELSRLIVIAACIRFVFGCVVTLEIFAFTAGSYAISGGDDPLQQRFRSVMHGCRIDERIGNVAFVIFPAGERRDISSDEIRRAFFDVFHEKRRVSCMFVAMVAFLVMPFGVVRDMGVEGIPRHIERRALGELAQIVQERREGDAAGLIQSCHEHSSRKICSILQRA
jgi:hypothetical protein